MRILVQCVWLIFLKTWLMKLIEWTYTLQMIELYMELMKAWFKTSINCTCLWARICFNHSHMQLFIFKISLVNLLLCICFILFLQTYFYMRGDLVKTTITNNIDDVIFGASWICHANMICDYYYVFTITLKMVNFKIKCSFA